MKWKHLTYWTYVCSVFDMFKISFGRAVLDAMNHVSWQCLSNWQTCFTIFRIRSRMPHSISTYRNYTCSCLVHVFTLNISNWVQHCHRFHSVVVGVNDADPTFEIHPRMRIPVETLFASAARSHELRNAQCPTQFSYFKNVAHVLLVQILVWNLTPI